MNTSGKPHVLVLMGGMSSEHDVSLNSGAGVTEALRRSGYPVTPVTIERDGAWRFADASPVSVFDAVARVRDAAVDCVFIALHGPNGEDGRVQGFLDILGVPYTGSGCAASALAMDKVRCKAVVRSQGVRVAGHVALDRATWAVDAGFVLEEVKKGVGYPCVIKPSRQGSSVGIEFPAGPEEFREAIERVFDVDEYLMVEEKISGVEVTCSVLNAEPGGRVRPLPVTEIRPKTSAYFDYHAKYTPGASEEITPARIPAEMADKVQEAAVHVHDIVGCAGWSRSDFIVDAQGPVWLEVNTVPGLTQTSLFPQAAEADGISYDQLICLLVDAAIRAARHAKEPR